MNWASVDSNIRLDSILADLHRLLIFHSNANTFDQYILVRVFEKVHVSLTKVVEEFFDWDLNICEKKNFLRVDMYNNFHNIDILIISVQFSVIWQFDGFTKFVYYIINFLLYYKFSITCCDNFKTYVVHSSTTNIHLTNIHLKKYIIYF